MTVRFSTRAPNSDYLGFEAAPEAIVTAAKKAEELGFAAVLVSDHSVPSADLRRYARQRARPPMKMLPAPPLPIDAVYFDAADIDPKSDDLIEAELRVAIPACPGR